MSLRQKTRKLALIGLISLGLLAGAPMRPEEIEEMLYRFSQPKVAHVLRQEDEDGEDAL